MQEYVIIVAGGSGSRMKSDIPKQFLSVNGLPVLMHTIRAFAGYSRNLRIIVVLPPEQFGFWEDLCQKHGFAIPHQLVAGGETRFHSVKNGLNCIVEQEEFLVAVHDGVRPVISREIIAESLTRYALWARMKVTKPWIARYSGLSRRPRRSGRPGCGPHSPPNTTNHSPIAPACLKPGVTISG